MTKRIFDLVGAILLLVAIAPLALLVALGIKLEDWGPVFYRQERIGRWGRPFRIWKFRSMRVGADRVGPAITASGDARITRVGKFLRKWKLDELPQLLNVIAGEMAFVGPRPEVARYVATYSNEQKRVLELRPGITDIASIEFRNEEELLARASDPEKFYCDVCIPRKIELNLAHARNAGVWGDVAVMFRTVLAISRPTHPPPPINER